MSRTYNTKHDFYKACGVIEYPNGYEKEYPYGVEKREPGVEYETDLSFSTLSDDNNHPYKDCVRHPNKKHKKGSLTKEFHTVGVSDPSKWKWRYGEEHDKSSRTHLIRNIMKHKRRHKLKELAKKIIEEEL